MNPRTVVGMCQGFCIGHLFAATALGIFGFRLLALGVMLMGLGWIAAALPWARVARKEEQEDKEWYSQSDNVLNGLEEKWLQKPSQRPN